MDKPNDELAMLALASTRNLRIQAFLNIVGIMAVVFGLIVAVLMLHELTPGQASDERVVKKKKK